MVARRRGVVRLVVPSPDGRRVLARPNGLAGWVLPSIPVVVPLETWTADAGERAAALLGAPVEPVGPIAPDAWVVSPTGRIGATGNTWITPADAARLGADEDVVLRWAESRGPERGDTTRG